MKYCFYLIVGLVMLASCKNGQKGNDKDSAANASSGGDTIHNTNLNTDNSKSNTTASATPEIIDVSGWEPRDISTVSDQFPLIINLPKEAKVEKNLNGGIDIRLSKAYIITINKDENTLIPNVISGDKSEISGYKDVKYVAEGPNGFICSYQKYDEDNGMKNELEYHFGFYISYTNKEDMNIVYSFRDIRGMDNSSIPGSAYSEVNAKKLFDIFKASVKVKE